MTRRCHSERSEESTSWMLHCACAPFSMTRRCHSEPERGIHCMDASLRSTGKPHPVATRHPSPSKRRGTFRQRRNRVRSIHFMDASLCYALFSMTDRKCHSERSEESIASMLRSVQHDKSRSVMPSISFVSFRARARNPLWMLRCACAPFSMTRRCHSEPERGIHCGCFTALALRSV